MAEGDELEYDTRVHFECVAPRHRARPHDDVSDLTFHLGRWAYCRAGRTLGHTWERIPPISYGDLKARDAREA